MRVQICLFETCHEEMCSLFKPNSNPSCNKHIINQLEATRLRCLFNMVTGATVQAVRLSVFYSLAVFLVDSWLGPVCVTFLQPYLGVSYAQHFELLVMLIWVWQAAQLTVWQLERPGDGGGGGKLAASAAPLLIGILGLLFLLIAELVGTAIRNYGRVEGTTNTYLAAGKDAVTGPVYGLAIMAYAMMPWFVVWNAQTPGQDADIWEINVDEQDYYCNR